MLSSEEKAAQARLADQAAAELLRELAMEEEKQKPQGKDGRKAAAKQQQTKKKPGAKGRDGLAWARIAAWRMIQPNHVLPLLLQVYAAACAPL